jgi:hypothetical protein
VSILILGRKTVKRTGLDANAKLNLQDPQVLQSLMDAMIFHEQGRNIYGADLERQAVGSQLGGRGAPVNQTVTINVNGAGDPHAVASAVADKQRDANADLIRYARALR